MINAMTIQTVPLIHDDKDVFRWFTVVISMGDVTQISYRGVGLMAFHAIPGQIPGDGVHLGMSINFVQSHLGPVVFVAKCLVAVYTSIWILVSYRNSGQGPLVVIRDREEYGHSEYC